MKLLMVALLAALPALAIDPDLLFMMQGGRPLIVKVEDGALTPVRQLNLASGDGISYSFACVGGECTLTIASGASATPGVYAATMGSSATWTVAGATHGLGTCDVIVGVMEASGTKLKDLNPGEWDCETAAGANQYDVVVRFVTAQAGRLVILKSGGGSGGGGAVSSVFGRIGDVTATSGDYSFSQIGGTVAVNQGGTGATTAAGARGALLPSTSGNGLKVLRANAGGTDYELATVSAGVGNVVGSENSASLSSWGTLAAVGSAGNCASKNISFTGVVSGSRLVLGVPSALPVGVIPKVVPGTDIAVVTLCNVGSTSVSADLEGTYTVTRLEVVN